MALKFLLHWSPTPRAVGGRWFSFAIKYSSDRSAERALPGFADTPTTTSLQSVPVCAEQGINFLWLTGQFI